MKWWVKYISPYNGLVLDPFAGTGTTAKACLAEGRKCILIVQDEKVL